MNVLKNWLRGLFKYIFREWIMYCPSHRMRLFFIRRIAAEVGDNTVLCMGIDFKGKKSNIRISGNCFLNKKMLIDGRFGKVSIGSNVDIGQETNIWTTEHDPNDDGHHVKGGDVTIQDYAWISTRVTILPGITIGKGAVVASGSVVTKSVPSMAIVGGVPAKVIGWRKNELTYNLGDTPRPFFY